jgi:hypothetical protein
LREQALQNVGTYEEDVREERARSARVNLRTIDPQVGEQIVAKLVEVRESE